jgi:NitT/TauT family transport system ATP-binding protein
MLARQVVDVLQPSTVPGVPCEAHAKLELHCISKKFTSRRGEVRALEDITLSVAPGEFVCLLGPSGCGKSTLLNIVAGLEWPDTGDVLMDGRPVEGPGSTRVLIFQEPALFPWLNVRDNVAFGLTVAGVPRADRLATVAHYLRLVHLSRFERAFVHELSGGMKQRVALARALALDPEVLLMDEPFGALDAQTRDSLHGELQEIWAQTGKTVLFVTHNVREALVLGDRVVLLSARPGRIKREFSFGLPRPRQIEDHAIVDAAREVLADLRAEVLAAHQEEADHERLAG